MYDGAHVLGLIAGGCFQDPCMKARYHDRFFAQNIPGPQGGFILSSSEDEKFQRKLNNSVFPGTCSSYHLHHVAGKVVALSEFIEYGKDLSKNTVANAQAFASALAAEGFDVLAESRGYTASHQVLTRHGELDSGLALRLLIYLNRLE